MPNLTVTALIAAYNEADVIEPCLRDLVEQGIGVYLIDDGSTDETAARAESFRGRGLIDIERQVNTGLYSQRRLMARKEELARTLPGDWFISHDADEFREGPWRGLNLVQSIELVDRLGFNAIDFEVLNFWPTRDLQPGEDPREAFPHFERGQSFNRVQIRCWKRSADLHLASSMGHEAQFSGRNVFPVPFLLRHYPIRGQAQGERKIFDERQSRFDPGERADGYHIQYEPFRKGTSLLRDPSTMELFDPDLVRAQLLLRHSAAAEAAELRASQTENVLLRDELERAGNWARELQVELVAVRQELVRLREELVRKDEELQRSAAWAAELQAEANTLHGALVDVTKESAERQKHLAVAEPMLSQLGSRAAMTERESEALRAECQRLQLQIDQLKGSLSWRLTEPVRRVLGRIDGDPS